MPSNSSSSVSDVPIDLVCKVASDLRGEPLTLSALPTLVKYAMEVVEDYKQGKLAGDAKHALVVAILAEIIRNQPTLSADEKQLLNLFVDKAASVLINTYIEISKGLTSLNSYCQEKCRESKNCRKCFCCFSFFTSLFK